MNEPKGFLEVMQWSDQECREYLESQRWPDGARCPKCGAAEPYTITRKSAGKNTVRSLYKCRACKQQFSATVGTIFEDSKIPLSKWFAAIFLMCSSKKGISAHQLHRSLDITYKSAWFMCHRVREAMREKGPFDPMGGTVEADETYVGGKQRGHPLWRERINDEIKMGIRTKGRRSPRHDKQAVLGMKERGGRVRSFHIGTGDDVSQRTVEPVLMAHLDMENTRLMTDASKVYAKINRYLPHDVIRHESEYVRGDIHTQGIEGYWSIVKRSIYGVYHHVDAGYLGCYLSELDFRFNRRKISDAQRFASLMGQMQGRVLWYCQKPQPENPFA